MATKYFILAGIVLCLLSCSTNSTQATRKANEDSAALTDFQDFTNTPTVTSSVKLYGDFTNVQSNGEHQWGYSVEIWRQDDRIYGLFSGSSHSIIVGDPPTGILVDQRFDEKTGTLSFRTKLPSHHYSFDGIFTKDEIKGTLTDTTANEKERIVLKRDKESSLEIMNEFASYEDWIEYADRILKFRGTK